MEVSTVYFKGPFPLDTIRFSHMKRNLANATQLLHIGTKTIIYRLYLYIGFNQESGFAALNAKHLLRCERKFPYPHNTNAKGMCDVFITTTIYL